MPGEGSRREEPLIRQRQLHGSGACIVHGDGQRPAHRHTNACTSTANRHGAVAVRAHRGGVCAHTGDRVTWVRRGTVPSVKMTLTVRKNVFFVFTIFAGTIFSKRSWVKVREVRSTQGGTGFEGSLIISIPFKH